MGAPFTMALTERPYKFCYSLNEIRYVFDVADLERAGLFLQVKIKYAAIGEVVFTELPVFELKPTDSGKVYLPIQAYIDSLLTYKLPSFTDIATNANNQCVQFYIEYREIEDADPDTDWVTDEVDHICIGIKGGIERHKASRNNIFINYIELSKPFLTWQPQGRFVIHGEPVYLSFLNVDDSGAILAGSKIKLTETLQDGTIAETILTDTIEGLLVHLKVDSITLGIDTISSNRCWYYEIEILDSTDTTIVAAHKFYIEYRPVYDYYDLVYHNSLGGIDALRVKGETDTSYSRAGTESEGGADVTQWNNETQPSEKMFSNILLARNYKGNIGNMNTRTKAQQQSFVELLITRSLYMRFESRWIPVINLKESMPLGRKKDTLQGLEIEWALSESNEVFTPQDKFFGLGEI